MEWQEPLNIANVRAVGKGIVVGSEVNSHALMGEIDMSDASAARDLWMLKNGHACWNCWMTYPDRPSAVTLPKFLPYLHRWVVEPILSREVIIKRIELGGCLACGAPLDVVSVEHFLLDLAQYLATV